MPQPFLPYSNAYYLLIMRKVIFGLLAVSALCAVAAKGITGDWNGKLAVAPGVSLKLVFHIGPDSKVIIDSPDQGAYGIEGETLYLSSDSIAFKVPALMMDYSGHLSGEDIVGTFRQMGKIIPLTLCPGENKPRRPQTPVAPFPYTTEKVTLKHGDVILGGTLTVPDKADPSTPVVVLVSGSGQQNRDEELFEHKPFAVIADYLARYGIASLRYDDRGVGESVGDVLSATTADFASDAQAVVDYLKESRRFGKVGLLGHSEGGIIGYMLAAKSGNLDFLISVAGPSVKGTKTIAYQNRISLIKSGVSQDIAEDFERGVEAMLEYKLEHPGETTVSDELIKHLYPQYEDSEDTRKLGKMIKAAMSSEPSNPWMMWFLAYDPETDMKTLTVPSLIIYGEKDCQVPPSLNAERARRLAKNATVKEYLSLNHLMQHAQTGYVEEYATIEQTISPSVLTDIVSFIAENTSGSSD